MPKFQVELRGHASENYRLQYKFAPGEERPEETAALLWPTCKTEEEAVALFQKVKTEHPGYKENQFTLSTRNNWLRFATSWETGEPDVRVTEELKGQGTAYCSICDVTFPWNVRTNEGIYWCDKHGNFEIKCTEGHLNLKFPEEQNPMGGSDTHD